MLGPEHEIKLSTGSEVQAREITHDYYNEGAQEAEEKNKEQYNLLTRTTHGAALASGEEKDMRTTITSYNGQEYLGWKLRKPTSVVSDPAGLDLTHTTVYDKTTGNVVETKAPGGTAETVYPPAFAAWFGSSGSGNGQFNHPQGTVVDLSGNVWVTDMANARVEKFSSSGAFIAAYGTKGSGEGQYLDPWGMAINQKTGNVYVSDAGNNRIVELNPSGGFVKMFGSLGSGNGQLSEPLGLTIDSHGNVWVADTANSRIEEFSETGTYVAQFGSKGSGNGQFIEPFGLTIVEGELYVVDHGNNRIEEFSSTGTYLSQFGSEGTGDGQFKEPRGIAANPATGVLYISNAGNERVDEFSPAGKFLTAFGVYGSGNDGFHTPTGIALNSTGELYIADLYNTRVDEWILPGSGGARMTYSAQTGSAGTGNGQFYLPIGTSIDGHGNVWVSDYYNNRIQELSATGKFIATYGSNSALLAFTRVVGAG